MKLQQEKRKLETAGIAEELEFSIEVTPQAMEILSGLYSDRPWAIVREYGTNMLDAYVKLPPDAERKPPQLHVPNRMEPWIEFKDYGVGMDERTLRTIFTRYFSSTKRDNNDEVGGLGLGAKTAFCYEPAESWVVESRHGGKRMVFHASKNERFIPTLNLVGSFPTEEPNGVTVKIPVAQSDIPQFQDRCGRLLRFFPIPVEVVGAGPEFDTSPLEYILRGETWGFRRRRAKGTQDQPSMVIMGNVPYPISDEELRNTRFNNGFGYYSTYEWALDMWVPIGAVKFVPSREELMYNPLTRKALAASVDRFFKEAPAIAGQRIKAATTQWEALTEMHKLFHDTPLLTLVGDTAWKGQKLSYTSGVQVDVATTFDPSTVIRVVVNERDSTTFKERVIQSALQPLDQNEPALKIAPAREHYIFLDDHGDGSTALVRKWMIAHCTTIDYRGRRQHNKDGHAYIFKGATLSKIQSAFGGAPVKLVSSLVQWEEELRAKEPAKLAPARKPTKVRKWIRQHSHAYADSWEETEVDVAEGGYYVSLQNDYPIRPGTPIDTIFFALKYAKTLQYVDSDVVLYGIPRSCKSLERKPGWKDFLAYVETYVRKDVENEWLAIMTWRSWKSHIEGPIGPVLSALLENPPEKGSASEIFTALKQAIPNRARTRALSELAEMLNIPAPDSVKPLHDAEAELARLCTEYPMLNALFRLEEDRKRRPYDQGTNLSHFQKEINAYLNS